ncbi:MAG TPA: SDR family oxidoreductase, partial [Polyangiaceae bacterium]|nr:SDR family oxidoreductase [Polyangiaceae bacterium]
SKMAATRTLAQIIELMGGSTQAAGATEAGGPAGRVVVAPLSAPLAPLAPVARVAVRVVPAPAQGFGVAGLVGSGLVAVTPDGGGVAPALVDALRARGVDATLATVDAIPENATGLLFLGGLRPVADDAAMAVNREAFGAARAVAARFREHGGVFVTVQDTGGDFGLSGREPGRAWLAGLAALAKTAREEWPLATAKAIDLERAHRGDRELAAALAAELFGGGPEVEVGLSAAGDRVTLAAVPCAVRPTRGPVAEGAVFVVTGGARGVTAASLIELGRVARPRVLLLGRTGLGVEPAAFHAATDEASMKRVALAEAKREGRTVTPRELGAEVDKLLAAREVRDTLAKLAAVGATARYEAVDVRDPVALRALFDDVRRTWGPIHGLVHGAGVLADAFIDKKTDAQFDRVFDTKVLGLRALLEATITDPLEWICLFSSVAARGGNAGQSDYAMANEILNKIAHVEAKRRDGRCRVCAIGWGPWDGGMVTPALRGHFLERGVALLPVREGADAFVKELSAAPSDDVEVVIGGAGADGELGLLGESGGVRARVELTVSASTHPQLASHRIQGKPVLPMVLAVEWFARLARALFPERASVQLRDVRVVRGVTLAGFDDAGDRFTLTASPGKAAQTAHKGVVLELRDAAGAVRYSAG